MLPPANRKGPRHGLRPLVPCRGDRIRIASGRADDSCPVHELRPPQWAALLFGMERFLSCFQLLDQLPNTVHGLLIEDVSEQIPVMRDPLVYGLAPIAHGNVAFTWRQRCRPVLRLLYIHIVRNVGQIKLGHCRFQAGPLRSEIGQHHQPIRVPALF